MNALSPRLAVRVREAELDSEAQRIDAFVAEHPEGTLFHRPQWSQAVERGCGQRAHYLIAERGGVLVGVLPLTAIRSRLFGQALVSAGFGTGGGILGDGVEALAGKAWSMGSPSVELRGGPVPDGWQTRSGIYANFARDLPGDAEALLLDIPRRQRAEIRKALEAPLTTTSGGDRRHLDAHFRVYSESVRNLGTPVFPRALFRAAIDAFARDADIVVAWHEAQPVAALLNFYFKGAVHPYWGGGTAAARKARANDLVQFDVMRRAIERGCDRADFGRSKIGTGAWSRKRIWGFEETPLTYGVRGEHRELNPLNPRYRLQIAVWQRLPLWAANRIGPLVARGLG